MAKSLITSLDKCMSVIANNVADKNSIDLHKVRSNIISLDKLAHKMKFSNAVINSMRTSEKQIYYGLQQNDIHTANLAYYDLKYQANFGKMQLGL